MVQTYVSSISHSRRSWCKATTSRVHIDSKYKPKNRTSSVYSNLIGSTFLGDGNVGPPRFVGVVMRDGAALRDGAPVRERAVGGVPMSRETVYGSSYPEQTA